MDYTINQSEYSKIKLILDNWCKITNKLLKKINLYIFYLPPYSPHFAPVVLWFNILKRAVTKLNKAFKLGRDLDSMTSIMMKAMKSITLHVKRSPFKKVIEEMRLFLPTYKLIE